MTIKPQIIFLVTLLCTPLFSSAQFTNTLENDKARPVLTPYELDTDSANYKGAALILRDRTRNVTHSVWTEFDKYKSKSNKDSSYIVYSSAIGTGKSSEEKRISFFPGDCRNGDRTLKASAPLLGNQGEIYVCWAGPKGLAFRRSLDSGATWLSQEKIIIPIVNGWEQKVDGVTIDCTPRMALDYDGAFKNRIYITFSDEKNSVYNKDIFLVYSDDRGETWTEPILVTYRLNHKEQFQPQISVQPGTGKVFLSFFDKQNYHNQARAADLYLAISSNGGLKFDYYRLNQQRIMLDSGIASVRGLVFIPKTEDLKIVWSQMTENERLHFYSVLVNDTALAAYAQREQAAEMVAPKIVKFGSKIKFDFELKKEGLVSMVITKSLDPKFSVDLLKDESFSVGQNTLSFEPKKLGLKKDNYCLTLYYNGRNTSLWILP